MTQYDVVLTIILLVNFVVSILSFSKSNSKDTRDLRDSIIALNANISHLNSKLEEDALKNKQDHEHFYKKINSHETRISILEDHDNNTEI